MLALTDKQMAQCHKYVDELYAWNRRVNLTAVARADAWRRHVEESLALGAELPADTRGIVDIGSGGGIPGIVLAIALPLVSVTLVEADQRKAGFLMHVAGLLELSGVTILAERADVAAKRPEHHERYDVAVSRAAGPVPTVIDWSRPFVRTGGAIIVMSDEVVEGMERRGGLLLSRKS